MKFISLSIAGALALGIAGCDGYGHRYAQSGPGTDIYSADQAARSAQEDAYLGLMCEAAGLPVERLDGAPACPPLGTTDRGWGLVAQAGLNDIDARCDAFMAWLNDQKRVRQPIIKELGTLSTAASTIMHTAGAGGNAVIIVAQAFSIATDSFSNYSSRLLLSVDHGTVTTLVRDQQKQFRESIRGAPIVTRPDAVNVIRSYLRICLPDSIESNINAYVVLASAGGPAAVAAANDRAARTVVLASGVVASSKAPLDTTPPKVTWPSGLPASEIRKIQNLFCLKPDGLVGSTQSQTWKTFVAYLIAKGSRAAAQADAQITPREWDMLRAAPQIDPCPS